MSNYWRIECTDCKVEMVGRVNHGAEYLADLLRHRAELEVLARAFAPLLADRDVAMWLDDSAEYCGCHFYWSVWSAHVGHRVRVVSEYGDEAPLS